MLGDRSEGLAKVEDWQFGEYFIMIEIKYLPAFWGIWYRLQTKRQSLYSLKL